MDGGTWDPPDHIGSSVVQLEKLQSAFLSCDPTRSLSCEVVHLDEDSRTQPHELMRRTPMLTEEQHSRLGDVRLDMAGLFEEA